MTRLGSANGKGQISGRITYFPRTKGIEKAKSDGGQFVNNSTKPCPGSSLHGRRRSASSSLYMVRPRSIPSQLISADDISLHRIVPAQQTIARYLKKHPKSQPALIINMYIMQKTGAEESDILQVYKQIQALAGPKKEMTGRGVWWCTLTLRNMGRCK